MRRIYNTSLALLCALLASSCGQSAPAEVESAAPRPSILLVTLDTTRADAVGPEGKARTPAYNAIAARGVRFTQAYATVPQTLPSHASMMTGLYPAGHGLHENARYLAYETPLLAEQLKAAGYQTAAFISAYPLAKQFGLARGFETWDEPLETERRASETTSRALAFLRESRNARPLFLWVHYFDPHAPYDPPEGFESDSPYLGEIEAMDAEMGRLLDAFQENVHSHAIVITADHGEGLGEHGEAQHGNLLYQGVMHVPLVIAGTGIHPSVETAPVSLRRIYHTVLALAGLQTEMSLLEQSSEVVMGEAMRPFLQYGWQPQVMAVGGTLKVIQAGGIEVYDVISDPAETTDLASHADLPRELRAALREYPLPSSRQAAAADLTDEEKKKLASLGYVAAETEPVVREDAPRPREMTALFDDLDRASAFFVTKRYGRAIPILERILREDPHNLSAALRLAAAHSVRGDSTRALAAFRKAQQLAPQSTDVKHYLALHYVREGDWQKAEPLLEQVLAETPARLPAIEALAQVRERQGRIADAVALWTRVLSMRDAVPAELIHLSELAMSIGNTPLAVDALETARRSQGKAFRHHLELGVLYLDARRFDEARQALDRVEPSHPAYPMALFKRAQVSVLLREPDRVARIAAARERADATTRPLIERERLFQNP